MKKQFLGLRTLAIYVPDLDAAKKWYTDVFDTKPYFDQSFYVGFNIAGYELGLVPEEKKYTNRSDNVVVYWGVEEITRMYEKLIKAGATEHEKPHNVGGEIVVASVKDPWDNVIGIIYNPEFKAN